MAGPTLKRAYDEILHVVYDVLKPKSIVMFANDRDGGTPEPVAMLENGEISSPVGTPADTELVNRVFKERKPSYGGQCEAAAPLLYQEEPLGVVWIWGIEEQNREAVGNTLWRLAQQGGLVLWSAEVVEKLDSGQIQVDDLLELEEGSY